MSERIQKHLASLGLASRRRIEQWIKENRISVNGKTATLGQTVNPEDIIKLDGKRINTNNNKLPIQVLIYNKPEGQVCTRNDPQQRPTVFEHLPKLHCGRWISVGRLDINTTGLILFTTDGKLANRLMHPSYGLEREYVVRVLGTVTQEMLSNLVTGVALEEGTARFEEIVQRDNQQGANQWYYVCLKEGRNREVRKIWETQRNIKVSRLKRVRYGNVFLPRHLKIGKWQLADANEIKELYQLADLIPPASTPS